jgi:hypothetical protein
MVRRRAFERRKKMPCDQGFGAFSGELSRGLRTVAVDSSQRRKFSGFFDAAGRSRAVGAELLTKKPGPARGKFI